MDGMPKHSAEGDRYAAAPRRDHLWVLVIIAVCALLEVWASWLAIGSMSGFPRIGGTRGLPTDWTLAVTTEAYWGYALYSWLAAAPGPRSRAFAMWSAVGVFILSLTGQGAAHLVKPGQPPPPVLVVFVTALPVLVLALIAILVHLRQADREVIEARTRAAEKAAREAAQLRAEADERTALRAALETEREAHRAAAETAQAELDEAVNTERTRHAAETGALQEQIDGERAERETAAREAAEQSAAQIAALQKQFAEADAARALAEGRAASAEAKAERLTRKLNPNEGRKVRANGPGGAGRNPGGSKVPNDIDARAEALRILDAEPGISGAELGERCGKSERWGQLRKKEFAGHVSEDGTPAENADS